MRSLTSIIVAVGTMLAATALTAQTYDPHYPVCLHNYGSYMGGGDWIDCSYTSMAQCAATASGLPATCLINPYYASARSVPPSRPYRSRAW